MSKSIGKTRKRISELLEAWTQRLGLRWWTITAVYYSKRRPNGKHGQVFATVYPDWRYMHARIDFNLRVAADLTPAELEAAVVHELCHVLVNELGGKPHHEERVCTTMARAFLWTRILK